MLPHQKTERSRISVRNINNFLVLGQASIKHGQEDFASDRQDIPVKYRLS